MGIGSAAALAAIKAGLSAATAIGGSYLQGGMNRRQMRYARKLANRGLTNSDLQAFELNQQSAQEARDWELEMDSTNYQRKVADMESAGVNPALAIGGVQSAPSSNFMAHASDSGIQSALGVQVPDLGSSLDAILKAKQLDMDYQLQSRKLDIEEKDVNRKIDETKSVIDLNVSKTEYQNIVNTYESERQRLQIDGQEASNDLTRREAKKIDVDIDQARQAINESIVRTENEVKKGELIMAQSLLAKVQADDIVSLRPFRKSLMSAQTSESKARASLATAQYMMQQGLLDGGALQMQLGKLSAEERILIDDAQFKEFITAVKTGDWKKVDPGADKVTSFLLGGLFRSLTAVFAELPVLNFFK